MIIAVGSWRGTGATTAALLAGACLAVADEAGAWLVEADPAGGVLAGRMHIAAQSVGGLERVAFPTERVSTHTCCSRVAAARPSSSRLAPGATGSCASSSAVIVLSLIHI